MEPIDVELVVPPDVEPAFDVVDALVVVALVVDETALWLDVCDIVAHAPPVELVP